MNFDFYCHYKMKTAQGLFLEMYIFSWCSSDTLDLCKGVGETEIKWWH